MKKKNNKPVFTTWPPVGHSMGTSAIYLRLLSDMKSDYYWSGIRYLYPKTHVILTEIINSVKPEMIPLWIAGSPPFLCRLLEGRLRGIDKGGKDE